MGSLCVLFSLRIQQEGCNLYCQTPPPAPFTDTHLKRTPHYYRQFTLSLGRKALKSTSIPGSFSYSFSLARSVGTERREPLERGCPYIFSQFNPLDTSTPIIRTLTMAPSVSFLTGFDNILACLCQRIIILSLSKTGLQTGLSLKALSSSHFNKAGARFSKVPIINGPGKLSPSTLKIEVSIVLHLT